MPSRPTIHPRFAEHVAPVSEGAMPDLARVLRATWIDDGQGGQVKDWVNPDVVYEGRCRLSTTMVNTTGRATEKPGGGGVLTLIPWTVSLPRGADVMTVDRIEVTQAGTVVARVFEVVGPADPQSYSHDKTVYVEEQYL